MRIVLKPLGVVFVIGIWAVSMLTFSLQGKKQGATQATGATYRSPSSASGEKLSAVQISNGSFTEGEKLPTGWTNLPWIGQGEARLTRDTQQSHSGPASLRLEGVSPQTYTALDHKIDGFQEGQTFTVRGWVKCEGNLKDAQIAIRGREVPGEIAAQKEYHHLFTATHTTDWTPFESQVTLKPGSKHAYFVIVLAGQGKMWIDDISITP